MKYLIIIIIFLMVGCASTGEVGTQHQDCTANSEVHFVKGNVLVISKAE